MLVPGGLLPSCENRLSFVLHYLIFVSMEKYDNVIIVSYELKAEYCNNLVFLSLAIITLNLLI